MGLHRSREDLRKNRAGISDPTAYKAIINVEKEQQQQYDDLIDLIEKICDEAGFEIVDQIVLKNKKSGQVYM